MNKENWLDVVRLASREDQKNRIFEKDIASNCFSLTQASIEGTWTTRAIYHDDILVGFTMYGYSEELEGYEVCRIMIDYQHQGKGHGRQALLHVIEVMKEQFDCNEILLTFHPENVKAKTLYESVGFKNTGKIITQAVDELIYALDTKKPLDF